MTATATSIIFGYFLVKKRLLGYNLIEFQCKPVGLKAVCTKNSTRMEINMSRIAVITDSNSGINFEDAKELGIKVLPMPFLIDGKDLF